MADSASMKHEKGGLSSGVRTVLWGVPWTRGRKSVSPLPSLCALLCSCSVVAFVAAPLTSDAGGR